VTITPLPVFADTPTPAFARFAAKLREAELFPLYASGVTTLQVNVGKRCNQACKHCHVEAGPNRTEEMNREVADLCLAALERHPEIDTLDITGGAPELNAHFRYMAQTAREMGRRVIDRCNLTVLFEPGQEDLAPFLAEHQIEVSASLPYYLGDRTDAQRGSGVFEKSMAGLQWLNELGYGRDGSGLTLNLVYNPTGAFLPPAQADIEAEYKRELLARHNIVFNQLFTITNMPIARFKHFLERTRNYDKYMNRLESVFNGQAVQNAMCRSLVSVGYEGTLYDCDFNQMLELPVHSEVPRHIRDFDTYLLAHRSIVIGDHCFGCTAGAGSSCGGQTV
jgi:radical SAM/Cys-rich protein